MPARELVHVPLQAVEHPVVAAFQHRPEGLDAVHVLANAVPYHVAVRQPIVGLEVVRVDLRFIRHLIPHEPVYLALGRVGQHGGADLVALT